MKMALASSASASYLAEDACRHLASLCRIYNDAGSAKRDADEGALNSLNFPEFHLPGSHGRSKTSGDRVDELLQIADYERRGLEMAMKALEEKLCDPALTAALRLFVDVTDLYGQVYVLKDVGTRTR